MNEPELDGLRPYPFRGRRRPCDVEKPADLIDCPTCRIIEGAKIYTAFGEPIDTMNAYAPSCRHRAVGFDKPDYRPECGTRADR